jgi:hypothetical protein
MESKDIAEKKSLSAMCGKCANDMTRVRLCLNVSSLPIMEKGEQFLRVIGVFTLLCSHYKISL